MIDYTVRELECFHAVAEELNFTRAAERLHLSQPPLSRHIRMLEERLGTRLFERDQRKVTVTNAGRLFLSETRGILEQLTRAQQRVRSNSSGKNLSMDVAFVGAFISESLVKTLCAFQNEFPEVAMTLHDCTPSDQLRSLAEGNIDLGFIGPAPKEIPKGVQVRNWRSEPLCALVPKDHELAGNTTIRLDQLAGHSLATVSHEAAPAYHRWLQDRFVENDTRPMIVQRADRAQAVCTMAAVSGYIALLTQSACMNLEGTTILPVTDKKGAVLEMTHVAAYRPCGPALVGKLIDFVCMGPED